MNHPEDHSNPIESNPAAARKARGRRTTLLILAVAAIALLLVAGPLGYKAWLEWTFDPTPPPRPYRDTPYKPSRQDMVVKILEVAGIKKEDVVYDLGSGDGRIVITAAKIYGCRAVGYEIDEELVKKSREAAKKEEVDHLATFEHKSFFETDISQASVIVMYLLPHTIKKLRPQLEQLKPGTRVVCENYALEWLEPSLKKVIESGNGHIEDYIFLYIWKKERK